MLKLLELYESLKVIIYRPLDELLQNATPAFSHAPTYINFYLQSMYVQRIGTFTRVQNYRQFMLGISQRYIIIPFKQ